MFPPSLCMLLQEQIRVLGIYAGAPPILLSIIRTVPGEYLTQAVNIQSNHGGALLHLQFPHIYVAWPGEASMQLIANSEERVKPSFAAEYQRCLS